MFVLLLRAQACGLKNTLQVYILFEYIHFALFCQEGLSKKCLLAKQNEMKVILLHDCNHKATPCAFPFGLLTQGALLAE